MFTDLFESSGGWVAVLIVGVIAIAAAIIAIILRLRGGPGATQSLPERGPSTAPGAPRAPTLDARPSPDKRSEQPELQRPAAATPTPNRPEGVGAATRDDSSRDLRADMRKYDRRRSGPEAAPVPPPARSPEPVPTPPPAPAPQISREVAAGAAAAAAAAATMAASRSVGEDMDGYVAVTVHYGTDRRDVGENTADPAARYSADRADTTAPGGTVSYGTCTVSIPKIHVAGGLEDRTWWQWSTGQARAPDQHVMVVSLNAQKPELFFSTLAGAVARSTKKDAFVFVHGFSVSFADAARRTAQMAYDLRFEGAPIFFSWPTPDLMSAPLTAYTTSEGNAELSKHRLRAFLQDVLEKSGAETLHIIAHSMGNRLVTEALQMLDSVSTEHLKSRIGEVILTAPDIDTGIFNEIIAPRLTKFASRVTLYASTRDRAIGASEGAHSNPRIGDFTTLLTSPAGVEVIDASGVDISNIGHSYYGDNEAVIADLCYLLNLGDRAAHRSLTLSASKTPGGAPCWSVMTRSLAEVYTAIAARRVAG